MARNMSSVRLRVCAQSARELLWEAMNGPSQVSATSQKPGSERCETSTIMPSSFIFRTRSFPSAESPRSGSLTFVPDMTVGVFHVKQTEETPFSFSSGSRSISQSKTCAPSTDMNAAAAPASAAASASPAVRQRRTAPPAVSSSRMSLA